MNAILKPAERPYVDDYRIRCRDCRNSTADQFKGDVCASSGNPGFTMIGKEWERAPSYRSKSLLVAVTDQRGRPTGDHHGYPERMRVDPERLHHCQSFAPGKDAGRP